MSSKEVVFAHLSIQGSALGDEVQGWGHALGWLVAERCLQEQGVSTRWWLPVDSPRPVEAADQLLELGATVVHDAPVALAHRSLAALLAEGGAETVALGALLDRDSLAGALERLGAELPATASSPILEGGLPARVAARTGLRGFALSPVEDLPAQVHAEARTLARSLPRDTTIMLRGWNGDAELCRALRSGGRGKLRAGVTIALSALAGAELDAPDVIEVLLDPQALGATGAIPALAELIARRPDAVALTWPAGLPAAERLALTRLIGGLADAEGVPAALAAELRLAESRLIGARAGLLRHVAVSLPADAEDVAVVEANGATDLAPALRQPALDDVLVFNDPASPWEPLNRGPWHVVEGIGSLAEPGFGTLDGCLEFEVAGYASVSAAGFEPLVPTIASFTAPDDAEAFLADARQAYLHGEFSPALTNPQVLVAGLGTLLEGAGSRPAATVYGRDGARTRGFLGAALPGCGSRGDLRSQLAAADASGVLDEPWFGAYLRLCLIMPSLAGLVQGSPRVSGFGARLHSDGPRAGAEELLLLASGEEHVIVDAETFVVRKVSRDLAAVVERLMITRSQRETAGWAAQRAGVPVDQARELVTAAFEGLRAEGVRVPELAG
jgi:hypothetical protein